MQNLNVILILFALSPASSALAMKQHTPDELLLHRSDPTFGGPDDIVHLIAQGADVNYKQDGWTPIARILSSISTSINQDRSSRMCSLLLQHGAQMFTRKNNSNTICMHCTYWNNIPDVWKTLFTESIFVPSAKTIDRSKKNVLTLLCCLKKMGIPKDLYCMILRNAPIPDIGNLMISRRMHGKPIPSAFMDATETALYDSTFKQFCIVYEDIRDRRPHPQYLNEIEAPMRENITRRLAADKLYANGEYKHPDDSCTIL